MIAVNERAYDKLTWAKKKDETYSDVIIRLVSTKLDGLQRRGEKEIVTQDNKRLILSIDQSLCMGAESCSSLAPEVFALDESRKREPSCDERCYGPGGAQRQNTHCGAELSVQSNYGQGCGDRRTTFSVISPGSQF